MVIMSINKDPQVIETLFNKISPQYDRVNRVLSLGIDQLWRKKAAQSLPNRVDLEVIDLASGTCDQLLAILRARSGLKRLVALDIAEEMLALGRKKVGAKVPVEWCVASAMEVPYKEGSFDAATISFGIRNVPDPLGCLKEMFRVVKVGGRASILEFSLPKSALLRTLHLSYLRYVVPTVGGWMTGQRASYRYLNETIESFPHGEAFCRLMRQAGFSEVIAQPLTGGIATLYTGVKEDENSPIDQREDS